MHRKTFDFRLSTFDYQHNMKLTLLVVGKTVGTELPKMIDTYVQRLKHYIPFDIQVIPAGRRHSTPPVRLENVLEKAVELGTP